MRIRDVRPGDEAEVLRMRRALWPGAADEEYQPETRAYFDRPADKVLLVAERQRGSLCGFAEASLHPSAAGCDESRPVAFLEGWYVDPAERRSGVGAALVAAVEAWGREVGCRELASDSQLGDEIAWGAHLGAGFEEVERVVKYRKPIALASASATSRGRIARGNLRDGIPADLPDELTTVLGGGGARIERIVSRGHVSPPGFWYEQEEDELVLVVSGAARVEVDGGGEIALAEGDWLDIGHHVRHRVTWTAPDRDTIWLAVFRRPS